MVRAAQIAAFVIALTLVLSAGGYGIARGIAADGQRQATTWKSATTCRSGTAQIPVVNGLSLPTRLPEGVCLSSAYYSDGAPATLWYGNKRGDKVFLVAFYEENVIGAQAPTGAPIQLGDLVGYVHDKTDADGTRFYGITFEKSGWSYSVSATLGRNGELDNKLTPDELSAVALSMAER
jgi:hypothetical protein